MIVPSELKKLAFSSSSSDSSSEQAHVQTWALIFFPLCSLLLAVVSCACSLNSQDCPGEYRLRTRVSGLEIYLQMNMAICVVFILEEMKLYMDANGSCSFECEGLSTLLAILASVDIITHFGIGTQARGLVTTFLTMAFIMQLAAFLITLPSHWQVNTAIAAMAAVNLVATLFCVGNPCGGFEGNGKEVAPFILMTVANGLLNGYIITYSMLSGGSPLTNTSYLILLILSVLFLNLLLRFAFLHVLAGYPFEYIFPVPASLVICVVGIPVCIVQFIWFIIVVASSPGYEYPTSLYILQVCAGFVSVTVVGTFFCVCCICLANRRTYQRIQ